MRPAWAGRRSSPRTARVCARAPPCHSPWTGTSSMIFRPLTSPYSPLCVSSGKTTGGQPECRRRSGSAPSCSRRAEPSRSLVSKRCTRANAGHGETRERHDCGPQLPSRSRALLDSIVEEGRKARLAHTRLLELHRACEPLEQTLAATKGERGDDDRQLVDEAGLEELPDDVCAAHDVHRLLAGGRARTIRRIRDAAHEGEAVAWRLFLRAVREDEEGHRPRIPVAPVLGGFVRAATPDDRPHGRRRRIEPGLVIRLHLTALRGVVAPRAPEHPVV